MGDRRRVFGAFVVVVVIVVATAAVVVRNYGPGGRRWFFKTDPSNEVFDILAPIKLAQQSF